MRRAIFFLVLAIAFALPATGHIKKAGTTKASGMTWNPPTLTSGVPTNQTTSTTDYLTFTLDVKGDTHYRILGHSEAGMKGFWALFYSKFDASHPTDNLVAWAKGDNSKPPYINNFLDLANGTYTVVISGESTKKGVFALHLYKPDAQGTTVMTDLKWKLPTTGESKTCATSSSYTSKFATYSWTAPKTETIDVVLMMKNKTYSSTVTKYMAIYNGTFPTASMNKSLTIDPCAAGNLFQKKSSSSKDEFYVQMDVVQGKNYTVAFSMENNKAGKYLVITRPTEVKWIRMSDPKTYHPPSSSATPANCAARSSSVAIRYHATVFKAEGSTYVIDQGYAPDGTMFDLDGSLYEGLNNATTPSSCNGFIISGDIGDIKPLFKAGVKIGNYYTLLTYNHFDRAISEDKMIRQFIMTGDKMGNVPGLPPKVDKPRALPFNSSAIHVHWLHPHANPNVTAYTVEYSKKTGATWGAWSAVPPAHTGTGVYYFHYHLTKATEYKYRVKATNSYGAGPYSEESDAAKTTSAAGRATISFALFALLALLFV